MKRIYPYLTLTLLTASNVQASPALDASGTLKTSYWTGDRDLTNERDIGQAGLWGKARLTTETAGQLIGEAWVQSDSDNHQENALLRELYWRLDGETWQLNIGKQLLAWGRADGINPTDNLSPRDFTQLAPEDNDLREGIVAVKGQYNLEASSLSLLWFPEAESHRIPLEEIPGVDYRVEDAPEKSQYAVQWEYLGASADLSLSWFDGYDLMPDLLPGSLTARGLELIVRNQRLQVLGGDISVAEGNRVWRAEIAWSQTDSNGEADFSHKKDQLWLVGGPEFTLENNWVVGLQLSLKRVFDFAEPEELFAPGIAQSVAHRQLATANQTRATQAGITWRIAKSALNDTLQLETSGVALANHEGGLTRVHVDYMPRDAFHIRIGVEEYRGASQTFFGQLRKNRLGYLELSYDF